MLVASIFYKTLGAAVLFCCYVAMVLIALTSSASRPSSAGLQLSSSSLAHTSRFSSAFLTTLSDERQLPHLITLARSLIGVQSSLSLVVLLPQSLHRQRSSRSLRLVLASIPNIREEYVTPVALPQALSFDAAHGESFLLLSAFGLLRYRRLLFLPVQSWLLRNIDHLLLSPPPLAFSIAVSAAYTEHLCAAFTAAPSPSPLVSPTSYSDLLLFESQRSLEQLPRHFLHPASTLRFTASAVLLAPSSAAGQRLKSVLAAVERSYHGASCRCDDVVDVLSAMYAHQCRPADMERQQAVVTQLSSSQAAPSSSPVFYADDSCYQRLPLNSSLAALTTACVDVPGFRNFSDAMQLKDCEDRLQLMPAALPASVIEQLQRVEQLTLSPQHQQQPQAQTEKRVRRPPYDAKAEAEREQLQRESRKYAELYLREQRDAAIARLDLRIDEKVAVHADGREGAEGRRLLQCRKVYHGALRRFYEALTHLRPAALPAAAG